MLKKLGNPCKVTYLEVAKVQGIVNSDGPLQPSAWQQLAILNGRPKNATGLPASLAHPAFGEFINALHQVLPGFQACWPPCPANILCKDVQNLCSALGASPMCTSIS